MLDVIICANFGVEKLRGQILEFSIEMAGHPYNRAGATAQPVITVHIIRVLCRLDDIAENGTPPGPGVVRNNVGRVGEEWSVVCVELTRLVRRTVVVRVTDR